MTQAALVTGDEPRRWGNAHPTIVPYQAFDGADRAFVVAVGNDAQWRRLCAAVGADELAGDARLATNPGRIAHREHVVRVLAERFRAPGGGVAAVDGSGRRALRPRADGAGGAVGPRADGAGRHLAHGGRDVRRGADGGVAAAALPHPRYPPRPRAGLGRARLGWDAFDD